MRALITGGCGFIGSAAVRILVNAGHQVLNIDKLTYAGDPRTVAPVAGSSNYRFEKTDILDQRSLANLFADFAPDSVFHLAAETHVDRSIDDPGVFIDTNLHGTFVMLQTALSFWNQLIPRQRARFRFIQVSTDEVYGSLSTEGLFHGNHGLSTEFPVFGEQGGRGSPCASVVLNVRSADRYFQLLEQLRPLSEPREADSDDHSQGPVGPTDSDLWRWSERS